jgi:hypothetical protein
MFLLGKLASKHAPTNHGGQHQSRQLGSLHTKLVTLPHLPGVDIVAA